MATRLPMLDAAAREAAPPASFERCAADERFFDYILSEFAARAPFVGKLRPVNALYESFRAAGLEARGRALVEHVRGRLGDNRTVFGIKHRPGTSAPLGWELYFYDFGRTHADLSIASIAALLAPFARVDAVEPWPLPWLMLSVELGPDQLERGAPARLSVYCDLRSYAVRGASWELENLYTFHDPASDIDGILHRLKSLVHLDAVGGNLARVLHPDFLSCHRFCVANKRHADAVYAARLPGDAVRRFLARHAWPTEMVAFFDAQRADLDHLGWDVGVDFQGTSGGLEFTKSSLYGAF